MRTDGRRSSNARRVGARWAFVREGGSPVVTVGNRSRSDLSEIDGCRAEWGPGDAARPFPHAPGIQLRQEPNGMIADEAYLANGCTAEVCEVG